MLAVEIAAGGQLKDDFADMLERVAAVAQFCFCFCHGLGDALNQPAPLQFGQPGLALIWNEACPSTDRAATVVLDRVWIYPRPVSGMPRSRSGGRSWISAGSWVYLARWVRMPSRYSVPGYRFASLSVRENDLDPRDQTAFLY